MDVVKVGGGRGMLEGRVWWGEWSSREKGWVHVRSSNANVELDLSGEAARVGNGFLVGY